MRWQKSISTRNSVSPFVKWGPANVPWNSKNTFFELRHFIPCNLNIFTSGYPLWLHIRIIRTFVSSILKILKPSLHPQTFWFHLSGFLFKLPLQVIWVQEKLSRLILVLRCQHVGLVKTQFLIQQVWCGAWEFACLTSFEVKLILLGPETACWEPLV